jgi:hypothetical protein
MELTSNNEPIKFLKQLYKKFKQVNFVLEYSIYESGGKGITKSRKTKTTPSYGDSRYRDIYFTNYKFIFDKYFIDIANVLNKDEELALHSKVRFNNKIYHIPQIDFMTDSFKKVKKTVLELKKVNENKIYVYHSGRSYHGYILDLLDKKSWIKYLGDLLLLNYLNFNEEVIDSRWIGHSLKNEFTALRLSCNTKLYKKAPTFVDVF